MRWIDFLRQVVNESLEDDLLGQAAQLSFYFLLALFPALLCLTAVVGMLPLENVIPRLMNYLQTVLPAGSLTLVREYLTQIKTGSGGGILSLGMLGAFWAASSGMAALISTLNAVYEVQETRSFVKARLVALGLTIGIGFFMTLSILLFIWGERVSLWVAQWFGFTETFVTVWAFIQWPLIVVLMLVAVGAAYYFCPNKRVKWRWISPGAVVAVLLWFGMSLGFKWYVENFNNYNAAYGSLAGGVVLMLWLYLSGAALLLGGEINSELDKSEPPSTW
ncbi:MAG: YihY/virulence factor BrkB family protein [Nitrospirales bacterium]